MFYGLHKKEKAAVQVKDPAPSSEGQPGFCRCTVRWSIRTHPRYGFSGRCPQGRKAIKKKHTWPFPLWRVSAQVWYLVVRVSTSSLAMFQDLPSWQLNLIIIILIKDQLIKHFYIQYCIRPNTVPCSYIRPGVLFTFHFTKGGVRQEFSLKQILFSYANYMTVRRIFTSCLQYLKHFHVSCVGPCKCRLYFWWPSVLKKNG